MRFPRPSSGAPVSKISLFPKLADRPLGTILWDDLGSFGELWRALKYRNCQQDQPFPCCWGKGSFERIRSALVRFAGLSSTAPVTKISLLPKAVR